MEDCFDAGVPITVEGNSFFTVYSLNCRTELNCEAGMLCTRATLFAIHHPYSTDDYRTATCDVTAIFEQDDASPRSLYTEAGCVAAHTIDFNFQDGALPGTPWWDAAPFTFLDAGVPGADASGDSGSD